MQPRSRLGQERLVRAAAHLVLRPSTNGCVLGDLGGQRGLRPERTSCSEKPAFVRKIGDRSVWAVSGDSGRARIGMVLVAEEGRAWPKRAVRAVYRCDWIVMVVVLAAIGGGMAALVFASG
jgi:hypothetical protein